MPEWTGIQHTVFLSVFVTLLLFLLALSHSVFCIFGLFTPPIQIKSLAAYLGIEALMHPCMHELYICIVLSFITDTKDAVIFKYDMHHNS